MVVAVPTIALGVLAETLLVLRTIVDEVMLTWDVKYLADFGALDYLHGCIELRCFRVLGNIAGVNHEIGRLHSRRDHVDLVDCLGERAGHIRVRTFVEADVAVADLHEREVFYLPGCRRTTLRSLGEQL